MYAPVRGARRGGRRLAFAAGVTAAAVTTLALAAPASEAVAADSGGAARVAEPPDPNAESRGQRARAHYEAGRELFDAGRYRDAIAEFARADAALPAPLNRYNIALCHERLGNWEAAIAEYRAYLEAAPGAPDRVEIEARISSLRRVAEGAPGGRGEPGQPRERGADADDEGREGTSRPGRVDGGVPPQDRRAPSEGEPGRESDDEGQERADDSWDDSVRAVSREEAHAFAERARRDRGEEARDGERRDVAERAPAAAGWEEEDPARGDSDAAPPAPGGPAPGASAEVREEDDGRTPFYRSWWFWGVAGVSALILLDIATMSPTPASDAASLEQSGASGSNGVTVWSF